jgi:hypothetical protein
MGGGLDITTPPLSVNPGHALAMVNFEPWYNDGYRRIPGYERFDGRPKPSAATFVGFDLVSVTGLVVGDTLAGGTGSTNSVVVAISGNSIAVTKVLGGTGTYVAGEVVTDGSGADTYTIASTPAPGMSVAPTTAIGETFLLAAELEYRDDIAVVPGSGAIRGVWQLQDNVYAWRNNADDTLGIMHKATASGWSDSTSGVTLGWYLRFDGGGGGGGVALPLEGDVVDENGGSAQGVVHRVVHLTGSTANNDATGYIVFTSAYSDSPPFANNDRLDVSGTKWGDANGVSTHFSFAKDGHYRFINHNFFGGASTYNAYGCNGVGPAFEIDQSGHVSPILHASAVEVAAEAATNEPPPNNNKPFLIIENHNHLFLAFEGGSLQHTQVGEPLSMNGFLGAAEFGIGDEITGLAKTTGEVLAVITERESRGLFGSTIMNWQLKIVAEKTGGKLHSIQNIDTVYGMDDLGVTSIARTDAFGDFSGSTVSQLIQPLVNTLRPLVTDSTISRTSSQYRVYFSDKSQLYMYVPAVGSAARDRNLQTRTDVQFGYCQYPLAVTRIWNSEDAAGVERTYFGSATTAGLGFVYEDQIGRNFDGAVIEAYVRLPFNHIGTPSRRKRFRRADLELEAENLVTIQFTADLAYGSAEVSSAQTSTIISDVAELDVFGGGGFWDDANWDEFLWDAQVVSTARADLTGSGENVSLLIYNETAKAEPFILQGITLHYDERRLQR